LMVVTGNGLSDGKVAVTGAVPSDPTGPTMFRAALLD
jgi:hypothetical protein